MKNIYIVISQTGSIVSKIIRRVTGDKYTHASISFEDDLSSMYSFGRIYTNLPMFGGFVKESTSFGAMKKFRNANIVVVRLSVQDEKYKEINEYILKMYEQRKKYHYNYIGLFLARRGIHFRRQNHFYCSEFVKDLLQRFNLVEEGDFAAVTRPVELLNVRGGKIIYQGRLCEYEALTT